LSWDEEEPEDTLGQERRDCFAPTFRNDGNLFHYFMNCMLHALFTVPQFLKALQRRISATTGHRCTEVQQNCIACQLLRLVDKSNHAREGAVLDPDALRKAVDASTNGKLAHVSIPFILEALLKI
jgi:hypothetical protein